MIEFEMSAIVQDSIDLPGMMFVCLEFKHRRNAMSHKNVITFKNPNAGNVSWHHISYGPADNGRALIGGGMEIGDVMILLFEVSEELDRQNAPIL